jgi:hypothetical protein
MRPFASVLLSTCALVGIAHAEPGAVSSVSGPGVTENETRFEVRAAVFDGGALDERWQYRAQASHGFTDWWQGAVILRAAQPADENAEVTSVGVENRFEFTATHDWPIQVGGQFEYKIGVNGAEDEVEFKLLAERRVGAFSARLNLNAARELSDGAEWEPAYAARGMWRASDRFDLGLEAFGEPDVDAHYVGPRTNIRFGDATFGLGYLVGFDGAQADGQLRISVELSS